jgi:hypothetical protein
MTIVKKLYDFHQPLVYGSLPQIRKVPKLVEGTCVTASASPHETYAKAERLDSPESTHDGRVDSRVTPTSAESDLIVLRTIFPFY